MRLLSSGKPLKLALPAGSEAMPALCRAAHKGDPAEVRRLLAEGADVNATDPVGATPLRIAALHKRGG
ncbi:hypothetical protein ABPG75_002311 [Micractinium tetrahymenae]